MTKLYKEFSIKKWEECCGKFCKNCEIAQVYKKHFGKTEAPGILLKERKKVRKKLKKSGLI